MNRAGRDRPAEILLVEDNDNDEELARIGFRKAKLSLNLRRVKDGEECMAYLHKQGAYAKIPTPDLVLLDLNMPRMNGKEVLAAMAADEGLRGIPVVVLSTSANQKDVAETYQLGCRSYIVKPVDLGQFIEAVRLLMEYWFSLVVLPKTGAPEEIATCETT